MRQWPPRNLLTRALLWYAALVIIALVTLSTPVSWAAPVTVPPNQTVPPPEMLTYLPRVSLTRRNLIVTLRADGRFSTLLQALDAANLTTALEFAGPFTMFAPTDAAFASLPSGVLDQLLANPTGQLTQILLFHIVPGAYETDDLEEGMQITTQQGSSITVDRSQEPDILINGARILTPNLKATNGVAHAIDILILPPPPYEGSVNAGNCGGDDGCKFNLTGGPTFAANGGSELKLQLFFLHSGIDGGQPQGDYRFGIERDGQLISAFADTTSLALFKNLGDMGPYNYEAKVQVSNLPGGRLEGTYYFWVMDGNKERDSEVFSMYVAPGQGEIWIQFDQHQQ